MVYLAGQNLCLSQFPFKFAPSFENVVADSYRLNFQHASVSDQSPEHFLGHTLVSQSSST